MGDGVNGGGSIDEGFFRRYRALLDAEDAAFDELEHAYEEGQRARFDDDLGAWRATVERRAAFLEKHNFAPTPTSANA
ncbi:MAG: hypothetical protein ACHQIG_01175 [Acidimicrobiia bacterium]